MRNELAEVRSEVRTFLASASFEPTCDSWMRGFDRKFSRAVGEQGWIGMTVPPEFGGHGRTYAERFAVTEELLRAGAPVAAHWIADRQVAPMLLRHGARRLSDELLPRICRGEVSFCIGMSEPDAGSDVAAIRTSARRDSDAWVINGQKVWTTGALEADYCYLIARTAHGADRHEGLSELVVPMTASGITVRPIADLSGQQHFTEIFFDDVRVADWQLVGEAGAAFKQVLRQLDFERSGPERLLSTYPLFESLLSGCAAVPPDDLAAVGRAAARYAGLRAMSHSIAEAMDAGSPPSAYAAMVKDLGTELEQGVVDLAADLLPGLDPAATGEAAAHLEAATTYAPAFTLRGGTTEILREVVARRMLRIHRDG